MSKNLTDEEEVDGFKKDVDSFPAWLRLRADDLEKQIAFSKPEFSILQIEDLKEVVKQISSNIAMIKWRIDMFEKAYARKLYRDLGLKLEEEA